MASRSEKRGRRRGKRPRDSSREDKRNQATLPVAANYTQQSNVPSSEASFDRPSQSSGLGAWKFGESTTSTSEPQYGQLVNAITSPPPPGKVAIPPLRPPQGTESFVRGSKKGRTTHACDNCRRAKTGCSGEQPCERCKTTNTTCVYGDGKREHDRKMLTKLTQASDSLNQSNIDIIDALRRIQLDTTLSQYELRSAIDGVIATNPESPRDSRSISREPSRRPQSKHTEHDVSENELDWDVGSTGSLDVINVDTDRDDTRATGHLGKSSSVAWAKRTKEEVRRSSVQDPAEGKFDTSFTLSSYHVEDADVEYVDTSNVNPYDWPEYNFADRLVEVYFDHTHGAFPILDKAKFMEKYNSFPRGSTNLGPSDLIWLGTLNLVFATSAVFEDLTSYEDQGHVDDHWIYSARAKALCIDQEFLFQDPRLSTTCFLGLLSLYYVSSCKLNRAWIVCGLAFRNALALGLHVRSEVEGISDVEKEHRVRLWWSLYSLEVLLNELTGRPSCISDRDVSTPFPVNIDENEFSSDRPLYRRHDSGQKGKKSSSLHRSKGSAERPFATYEMPVEYSHPLTESFPLVELPVTSSTYFIYRTQLSIISHEIVTQLYCAATAKEKWTEVQDTMRSIDRRLLSWRNSLPTELGITFDTWTDPDWDDPYTLPRIGLATSWNSSRMILFRPCLCRVEGRLDNTAQSSRDFEQDAVEHCIHSARNIISLLKLSTKSDAKFYSISPWWNTLHYLCEALSVLMLEIAFEAQHLPNEKDEILADAKHGVFWLVVLSSGSIAARKAWEIFDNLIRLVAPKIKWSVFDLPTTAPIPAHYNWRRFGQAKFDPWSQLSRQNLQEQQAAQPLAPDLTAAWTNLASHQFFLERTEQQHFGNQLNRSVAVERFVNMGQLYGNYNDRWPQLFAPTMGASPTGMGGTIGPSQAYGTTNTGQEGLFPQDSFDRSMDGYETLSATNSTAQAFQQQDFGEQQEQIDMQRREQEFGRFDRPSGGT